MLDLFSDHRLPGGRVTRRTCLRAGFLTVGGLALSDLLRLRACGAAAKSRDTAVILLFTGGGPSHLETYDMKPDAPTEIRGPFRPIRTTVPGIEVCEHLPLHAKTAERFTLIRSCSHEEAHHFYGLNRLLSGYGAAKPDSYESKYPQVGAVAGRMLHGRMQGLPASVGVGTVIANGPDLIAGIGEGYWSPSHRAPIVTNGIPSAILTMDAQKLGHRVALLQELDRMRRDADQSGMMGAMDDYRREAVDILTANRVRDAFDLAKEDPGVRERYGDGWGRDVLLARRLAEAGVAFISVGIPGCPRGGKAHNWDDHAVNWDMREAMLARMPQYDQVVTTLIHDVYERGLDKKILVLATGEFGRTPRLEFKNGRIGRDHWPSAMSMLVSGGGMRMGQVIGATNRLGEYPIERRLDPHDVLSTIYRHLGIDHKHEVPDAAGRPVPLTRGTPIAELM